MSGTGAIVLDFWRFALSDLKMNNVRGYVVEFLVARAVGTDLQRRRLRVRRPDGDQP
ncbi:hypothetical protein [Garicola koreensis]|uniref:hypothetical protein n=1 Tax=Garicola koreensis TaxID=1262554 RepID=UPI0031EE0159